jgi:GrpB-like predicted nucleotidyltransferase (UPF0157 family)
VNEPPGSADHTSPASEPPARPRSAPPGGGTSGAWTPHPANGAECGPEHAPAGADDGPIKIVEFDPAWPAAYAAERERLAAVLPAARIHHIGSTAVPGLAAKPVIDMIAFVEDLNANVAAVVERAGYSLPERFNAGLLHRRFLCYPTPSYRTHHLHLVDRAEDLEACIGFRDVLRADAQLAADYVALKRRLAERYREDRAGYTEAKSEFIMGCAGATRDGPRRT